MRDAGFPMTTVARLGSEWHGARRGAVWGGAERGSDTAGGGEAQFADQTEGRERGKERMERIFVK